MPLKGLKNHSFRKKSVRAVSDPFNGGKNGPECGSKPATAQRPAAMTAIQNTQNPDLSVLLPIALAAVRAAGAAILATPKSAPQIKPDGSPVTAADIAAHQAMSAVLLAQTAQIPLVSEEGDIPDPQKLPSCFWVADPLDGTKGYINGSKEFSVNLALIVDGQSVLGVVAIPARGEIYYGYGQDAFLENAQGVQRLQVRAAGTKPIFLVSATALKEQDPELMVYIGKHADAEIKPLHGALKLVQLAAGLGDHYPRFHGSYEWDIAAGQAILQAAGGAVLTKNGQVLRYGKADFFNPPLFAYGQLRPKSLPLG